MSLFFRSLAPFACAALAVAFGLSASHSAFADEAIRVGMIPDAGATQVSIEEKAPLQDYLSKMLGRPVKLVIPTNYNATVEGLGNKSLDFAYLGGLTYVKAHASYGVVPLVQRDVDQKFHSLFVTQANSSIHSLKDLKGKRFAFGDIISTSGHLIPYSEMLKAGIDPDRDLQSHRFTGSHPATLQAVAAGVADAGAMDETVFKSLTGSGKVDPSKVRVFYSSPPFADYVWAARKDIDPQVREKFAEAFLKLKKGEDSKILTILRGEHFTRASNDEYKTVEDVARRLEML
jgi:phosphonate transport system substrate-binding protein